MRLSRHDALLLLVVLIWGANFGFVKVAVGEFNPMAFTTVRLLLCVPAILVIMRVFDGNFLLEGHRLVKNRRDLAIFAALSIFLAADNIFFVWGLKGTTSTNASILYATSPILVAVISVLKGQGISRLGAIGLALAFGGVILVNGVQGLSLTVFSLGAARGNVLICIGVVSWALFSYLSTYVLNRYSTVRVTAYAMTGAAGICTMVSLRALMGQSWASVSWVGWGGLLYSAFFSTLLCLVIWYYGISRLGSLRVITYEYLVPVIAITLAFVLWREDVHLAQVVGAVLVLMGVRLVRAS